MIGIKHSIGSKLRKEDEIKYEGRKKDAEA